MALVSRELVVQKFGGTSVASPEHIRRVALRALGTQRAGRAVVVVVSAMAGETNRLVALGEAMGGLDRPERARERDLVAAAGEQVVAGLTALAIQALGGHSRSLLGHQVALRTDSKFGDAQIREVDTARLRALLAEGCIPVVAGFQGIDEQGNITTLGRGGSDTTAVALAAALGARVCEIYTDVDGVYTADPRVDPTARRLERVAYEQMLAMALAGAKVLHARSVEVARAHRVTLHVRSSFSEREGTWVFESRQDEIQKGAA